MVVLQPRNPEFIKNVKKSFSLNYIKFQNNVIRNKLSQCMSIPKVFNEKFKTCLKFIKCVSAKYKATVTPEFHEPGGTEMQVHK